MNGQLVNGNTRIGKIQRMLRIIDIPTPQSFYTSLFLKLQNVVPYKSKFQ